MNSDVLFEISKYIDSEVENDLLREVVNFRSVREQRRACVARALETKLSSRATVEELRQRNVIKDMGISFEEIHRILSRINFHTREHPGVAPRIAVNMSKIEFHLKKKLIMKQLGLAGCEDEN